ncbi:fimbrial assembly protein [Oscillatoriales cyanobacterium USR001]|nr:fimbrial assembly protein [Oscillatoriales cyanobacterium USR001]
MYSLDINFLNDRPDYKPVSNQPTKAAKTGSAVDQTPLIIGGVVALALNAAVGGAYWWVTQENFKTGALKAQFEGEAAKLEAQASEISKIEGETKQIESEYKALGTVFDQIKPWSAIWRDLADRIPPGVKISQITQTEPTPLPAAAAPPPAAASPSPSGSPSPGGSPSASPAAAATPAAPAAPVQTATLLITGVASSFEQVNDFVLLIQRSPFFKEMDTKLVGATLKSNTTQLEFQNKSSAGNEAPKLLPIVEYKIETALSATPASELLPELRNKQADGLAIRIETLQEKGVLAQKPEVKKP